MTLHARAIAADDPGTQTCAWPAQRTVLFLCTGNSARSILAESLLGRLGRGRFRALSAGSRPAGAVNPHALALLRERGLPVEGLRSKSWDEFAGLRAPAIDIVVTVCDSAAREACPVWTGSPVRGHWGIADPAAAAGSPEDIRAAFATALDRLERRMRALLALPVETMEPAEIQARLNEIGARADRS